MTDPREVIADALGDFEAASIYPVGSRTREELASSYGFGWDARAKVVLAALSAAGYEIVKAGEVERLRGAVAKTVDEPSVPLDWECVKASNLDALRALLDPA